MFDLAPTDEQRQLRDALQTLLGRQCTSDVVRASEPTGHDAGLWARIQELGLLEMALPDGEATLLDLAFVIEQLGEFLAPVPLLDAAVATRLAARAGATDLVAEAVAGGLLLSIAPRAADGGALPAVPSGAVADRILFLQGDELCITNDARPTKPIPNLGGLALADRSTAGATVLGGRDLYDTALAEWKALTAVQLTGAGRRALQLGIDYAKEREAFGVPVGSFQAIAHRLADAATALDAAQLLGWEAAWAHDGTWSDSAAPSAAALSSMALILAAEAAGNAAKESLHVFGGYGFMLEYDVQLYFRRIKAWGLALGDLSREPEHLADLLWCTGVGGAQT